MMEAWSVGHILDEAKGQKEQDYIKSSYCLNKCGLYKQMWLLSEKWIILASCLVEKDVL